MARLERNFVVRAFIASELQGIGGLSRFTGPKLGHRALLWGMYVRPAAAGAGAGLGTAIVRALLAEATRVGLRSVLLTVIADNVRAGRLYERSGFVRYGLEPGAVWTGTRYLDEALMIRQLDRMPT